MKIFIALLFVLLSISAYAVDRSQTEKRHFAKAHTCPSTGMSVPSCKGYRIDHIVPLCAGGRDVASNMQWQKYDVSILKDRIERAYCLCLRRHGKDVCPTVDWK